MKTPHRSVSGKQYEAMTKSLDGRLAADIRRASARLERAVILWGGLGEVGAARIRRRSDDLFSAIDRSGHFRVNWTCWGRKSWTQVGRAIRASWAVTKMASQYQRPVDYDIPVIERGQDGKWRRIA